MMDDRKNTERIETKGTERMLLDLSKLAALEDRSLSEYLRIILRRHLYGNAKAFDSESLDDKNR